MREIKFRAWDKRTNRMISWNQILNNLIEGRQIVSVTYDPLNNDELLIPMQFTGLRDRHGKEIWEGDIVKFYFDGIKIFPVKWSQINAQFLFMNDLIGVGYEYKRSRDIVVIGNIYENPELL